jgi:hypothetical protein
MLRIDVAMTSLPVAPPFRLRARVLTPLAAGGTRYLADGAVDVDELGWIFRVGAWDAVAGPESAVPAHIPVHDLRPWLVMPGLVDLHTHIPQLPNAGLGAGLDLLTWLERYTFPLERQFDVAAAERLGPLAMRAFAAAGTTTVVAYASDDPDATEAAFRGGWFHSGDLGVWHPGGYIELRDRAKDIIVSGGENISTIEVEAAIASHPAVLEVAVVGVPDDRWGERPKAIVVLREGQHPTERDIIEHVHGRLARYKAPDHIRFAEALPKTSTGKIKKFELREVEWQGRASRIQG